MSMRLKDILWIWLSALVYINLPGQSLSAISKGWAKNSINAPVFRKNSVVSHKGFQYVSYYDSANNLIIAKRRLHSSTWQIHMTQYTSDATDAHRSISIMVDGDGFLHLSWGHHNTALNYCKSSAPEALTLGNKQSMIGTLENDVTYPEFFKLPNGNLIFMYRHGVSGNGNLVVNGYDISTRKWSRLQNVLIDGQGQRNAYWQSCIDALGTIHVSWVWRETSDVATNHDMCYAKSSDGGKTWYKSTGAKYQIPITIAAAEQIKSIPQKSELINQTSMYADGKGRPYIASYWKEAGATAPQYHLIYKDGNGWKSKRMTDRKTNFSLSGSGTKKIPISRPQIVVDDRYDKIITYLIYRDLERDSKVSVNVCKDLNTDRWLVYDLSGFSVNSWEPSLDTELWRDSSQLNVFVQKVGQGDGETLENMPTQMVYIAGMPQDLVPVDTIDLNATVTGLSEVSTDEAQCLMSYDAASHTLRIKGHDGRVEIYDCDGRKVAYTDIEDIPVDMETQTWDRGMYIVRLKNRKGSFYERLFIE